MDKSIAEGISPNQNIIKQSYALALSLFSIFFNMMLNQTQRKWMIKTTFISTLAKMANPFNIKLLQTHMKTLIKLVGVAMDLVHSHKSFRSFKCDRMAMWQAQKSLSNTHTQGTSL